MFKSSILYTVGGALPMASGFALLPFYTKTLSVSQFGWLGIYIIISLLAQIISSYATDTYLGVNFIKVKEDKAKANRMLHQVFTFICMLSAGFLLISFLVGDYFFSHIIDSSGSIKFYNYGWMSLVTGVCNGIFKTYTNYHVYTQRAWRYFFLNLFNFFVTIVITLVGIYLSPNTLDGPVYGRLLSGVAIMLLSFVLLFKENDFRFDFSIPEGFHKFCFPYLIYLIMIWIVGNIDRFIINNHLDSEILGYYDFALKCVILIEFFQSGITSAFYPEVFRIWKNTGNNATTPESNRYFNTFSLLNILLASLMSIVLPFLLPFVIPHKSYYESFSLIGILAASYVTRSLYHYYLTPILYLQKTSILPKVFGILAAIQILGTYLFIELWGVDGIVFMAVFIKIAQVLLLWLFSRKLFSFSMNPLKMIYLPALYIAMVFVVWINAQSIFSYTPYLIILVLISLLIFIVYRKEIIYLVDKIKVRYKRGN